MTSMGSDEGLDKTRKEVLAAIAPKTYENGLREGEEKGRREAFEAACKAHCSRCAAGESVFHDATSPQGVDYFHRVGNALDPCNARWSRRVAAQMGVTLEDK